MFDGFSLIASLLTIGGALAEAIKYVRTLCRASEELEALQKHVQNYALVIEEVERRQNLSPTVLAVLTQARSNLDELEELIDGKIKREENSGRSQVRRRAWAKHKSRVYQTRNSLMDFNTTLLTAIVIDSSTSAHECLSDIQYSQDAMLAQVNTITTLLRASSTAPMTVLDASPHFLPERYTQEPQIPSACLIAYEAHELYSGTNVTRNVYRVLYQQSPRHWKWLIITIEIFRYSKYWAATKISPVSRKWSTLVLSHAALIPHSLLTQLSTLLCQQTFSCHLRPLRLSLPGEKITFDRRLPGSWYDTPLFSVPRRYSLDAVNYVHDLGCDRYVESQVVQLEIIDHPSRLRSCVNGILVVEVKCMDAFPSLDWLYNIRVLHCMKGASGFARLVGVVTNDEGTELKSYTVDFPKARYNIMQLAGDPSISWERRERWAFQVIQSVSQMHQQGFVLGGLTTYAVPLILDTTDSIVFWMFRERIVLGRTVGVYYPPELVHLRDMSPTIDEADRLPVTSKMDIFHLGLLLWLLAERRPITRASPVCMRSGCGEECNPLHAEPVALPPLSNSVPRYYRDIVDSCRAEKPGDRPAARDLLPLFPNRSDALHQTLTSKTSASPTIGEGLQLSRVTCSICWKRPPHRQLPIFHCNVCEFADFDLCQECFEHGTHCHNDDHLLVELGKVGSWVVPRKYHSCVKGDGYREVIDL